MRCIFSDGRLDDLGSPLCSVDKDGYGYNSANTFSCAVRPVLTLEPGILDEIIETGTKENPIEIYQNN